MSAELGELAKALVAFEGEVGAIPKTGDNSFFNSKYAELATVVATAAPVASKHGLAVSQWIGYDSEGRDVLTTILMHTSGQYLAETMLLRPVKLDPQAQGSATTYGRRYSYMAALGLVADDDDDGNKGTRSTATTQAAGTARATTPATPQPQAAPRAETQRPASANQRGLIFARAGAAGLSPIALANVVLTAMGEPKRQWDDEGKASNWLQRALDRLPMQSVDTVLEGIVGTTGQDPLPVGEEAGNGRG
jgi:hypothetical protein